MHKPQTPNAFYGTPTYATHPAPTPVQEPVGGYARPVLSRVVPALAPAMLTVRRNGDVTFYQSLLWAVDCLKMGAPVDVVPPLRRGGVWHLDTRSSAPLLLPTKGVARFAIRTPSPSLFLIPAVAAQPGVFGGANGTAGYHEELHFALGSEVPGHPGYYELLQAAPLPRATEAECLHGHALTPENVYGRKDRPGTKFCRQCKRDKDGRRRSNGVAHR